MQKNTDLYHLTYGSFFEILVKHASSALNKRASLEGQKKSFKEYHMLGALIGIFDEGFENSFEGDSARTFTTNLKTCSKVSPSLGLTYNYPFSGDLSYQMSNKYNDKLSLVKSFIDSFINKNKVKSLSIFLLSSLSYDRFINEIIYLGRYRKKEDILKLKNINIEALLLGIWHEVLQKANPIELGKNAYNDIENDTFPLLELDYEIERYHDPKKPHLKKENNTITDIVNELIKDMENYEEIPDDLEDKIQLYNDKLYDKYQVIKTLLYKDTPKEFYDFYICNDIKYLVPIGPRESRIELIKNIKTKDLLEKFTYSIISGNGGLGKSMMMRHLLLNAIDDFDELQLIPIFASLKEYDENYKSFFDFIFERVDSFNTGITDIELRGLLTKGACLLLLDGLDEIKNSNREKFDKDFEFFLNSYSGSKYVISSRPYETFIKFNKFTNLELQPFDIDKANKLISRLEFRPDAPEIKEKFLVSLNQKLWATHHEFIQNPLLLTIMLMTFEDYADIPSKMHIFYSEAFTTLAQKHDANKGAFKRVLATKLSTNEVSNIMSEFCARTYRDEKFEFTKQEFENYFNSLKPIKNGLYTFTADDLLKDLVENICIMYYESSKYHFVHRSFQEYFAANFFAHLKNTTLTKTVDIFEIRARSNDYTFMMLYDMIPNIAEEFIILPYLKKIYSFFESNGGIDSFIDVMYPTIYYNCGTVGDVKDNIPYSYLFSFVLKKLNIVERFCLDDEDGDFDDEYMTIEWGHVDTNWKVDTPYDQDDATYELVDLSFYDDYISEFGTPDIEGRSYEIPSRKLIELKNEGDEFETLYDGLVNSVQSPIILQYNGVKNYLNELINKYKEPKKDTDLFDID